MLSCLEYMYHDLGLVKEFNMNPITLKRWLVITTAGVYWVILNNAESSDTD